MAPTLVCAITSSLPAAHVSEVAPKILPALNVQELKARNAKGVFHWLSSLADPPRGCLASPTHLAYLEAAAASAAAADSLASRFVHHTAETTVAGYSKEQLDKFVAPAIGECGRVGGWVGGWVCSANSQ